MFARKCHPETQSSNCRATDSLTVAASGYRTQAEETTSASSLRDNINGVLIPFLSAKLRQKGEASEILSVGVLASKFLLSSSQERNLRIVRPRCRFDWDGGRGRARHCHESSAYLPIILCYRRHRGSTASEVLDSATEWPTVPVHVRPQSRRSLTGQHT